MLLAARPATAACPAAYAAEDCAATATVDFCFLTTTSSGDTLVCDLEAAYTGGPTGFAGPAELVVVTEGFYASWRTVDAWGTDVYGDGFCCSIDIPLTNYRYELHGSEMEDRILATDGARELEGPNDPLLGIDKLYMYGYEGGDSLAGTAGQNIDDCAWGGNGHDEMNTRGGLNNHYYGEAGDDYLLGGATLDTLDGGNDNDILRGLGGVDLLLGGDGDDFLDGGDGDESGFDGGL